jgi:hypothetical protein
MAIPFKAAIDLEQNELLNARIQVLASDPPTPVSGQVYFHSGTSTLRFYTGSAWIILGRLDQVSAPTGDVSLNSRKITNLATPTADGDAVNKQYADNLALGIDAKQSVRAATTANITLSGAQTIDGVSVVAGQRVLVKNQSSPANNGIYVAMAGAWTRALDFDEWAEVPGAFVFVEEGGGQADTGWLCTSVQGGTLGTTAIVWVQFSQAGVITAGTGLAKTGTEIAMADMAALSVKARAANSVGAPADLAAGSDHQVLRRSGTTLAFGALALNQANATTGTLPINRGGTGGATEAAARVALGVPRYFVANVGATSGGNVTVTHNLGTRDVQVQVVRVAAPYETIYCDVERDTTNAVILRFGSDYAVNTFRVIIVAAGT